MSCSYPVVVSKFGGSSVRDASAMKRCAAIVESRPEIKIVIISATYQTTNHLEEIARLAISHEWETCLEKIESMQQRHLTLASDLLCSSEARDSVRHLCHEVTELARIVMSGAKLSESLMDQIYSIGERLSSSLFSDYLKTLLKDKRLVCFKDAREALKTSNQFNRAEPLVELTKERTRELWASELQSESLIVTQGFIGSTQNDETTTLGREGSDYSATLFGEAIGAGLVQIWTDVCGIATGDPRHVDGAIFLESLCYEEATLMAENGAKVLFERTLAPAQRAQMKVFVGSSLEPNAKGTLICESTNAANGPKGVAFDPLSEQLTVVGLEVDQNAELKIELEKLGGCWVARKHLYQREKATYQDFKLVHSLIASSLK